MRLIAAEVLLLSIVLLVGACSAVLVGPSQGYVTYVVFVGSIERPTVFILNETVAPTGQSGFLTLAFDLKSSVENFTYSTTVNSSSFPEIFPYLVGVNNQSISYDTNGISLTVHIHNTGSVNILFQGATYSGTSYQVSVSAHSSPTTLAVSGNGTITTLPSGLIYSVHLEQAGGSIASAQLWNTSLPFTVATGSSLPEGLAVLTIGLLAATAFAVPSIFIRLRKKPNAQPATPAQPQVEEKPSYWVD